MSHSMVFHLGLSCVVVCTAIVALSGFPQLARTASAITQFPIATISVEGQGSFAQPAFDGTNYLVGIQGDATDRHAISAQLVSPSGTLVGPLISTGRTGGAPGVVFDDTNYVMAWTDDGTSPQNQIYGQFISPSRSLVGAPFRIGPESGGQELSGGGFDGTNFLAIWQCRDDNGTCPGIYGQLVSRAGALVGPVITISATGKKEPRVAFDGTNYLVVWFGAGVNNAGVVGKFISPSGTAVGSEIVINASPAPSDNPGNVVFDGTEYLVVWNDEIGGMGTHEWNIYGQLVTPSGALTGSVIPIVTEPGPQILPYVASDGSHFLVTWTDFSNDTNNNLVCEPTEGTCADVYGRYLAKSGTPIGTAFPIAAGADNQGISPVRFAGGKFFVVWNSGLTTESGGGGLMSRQVFGAFLTPPSATCVGDCDASGDVTVNEIITLVNIALGNSALAACTAGDADSSGDITIDEIIAAVNNALNGC